MAEKSFGVKEINLIGASGTPTIESPNNLNLNAVNVAISTNVSIGGTLSVTGNVSIGGTLTYEDVTNIDSVGLITARSGIVVGAGKSILVGAGVTISSSTKGDIQISGIATAQRFDAPYTGAGSGFSMEGGAYNNGFYINNGSGNTLIGLAYFSNNTVGLSGNGSSPLAFIVDDVSTVSLNPKSGAVNLSYAESGKLSTSPAGITVTGAVNATGIITATNSVHVKSSDSSPGRIDLYCESGNSHYIRLQAPTHSNFSGNLTVTLPNSSGTLLLNNGSAANLTNIPAPVEAPVVNYTVTANGSSAYRFSGGGVDSTADDPDLYLIRGQKYRFNNTTGSAHPFQFRLTTGGSAYTDGITGDQNGVQFFTPALDAPSKLYYICTLHSNMVGTIYLRGAGGNNENVGVTTFSSNVLKPNHPSFCARHNSGDGFSGDIIVLTRISTSWDVWNTGGHYSTTTGKFTAPVTGVYYFEGQVMSTGHSNGDNIQDMLSLESNNGRISYCRQRESYFSSATNANGYYTNSVGGSTRLSSGDTVWIQRHSSQNWSYSNRYYSYFTGWLIG